MMPNRGIAGIDTRIELRSSIAQSSDWKRVVRLCRRAVGHWDYVLFILREAIADKGLFLAWHNNDLVGMTNFEKCVDGSGWLSMARTDPKWRRRGVAIFLQQEIAAHAKRKGINILRLWTSSGNGPSIRACRKGSFKPVCEASHLSHNIRSTKRRRQLVPLKSASRQFLSSALESSYITKMNGYMAYKWQIVKASEQLLTRLLRRRELYSAGDSLFVLTKPERIFRRAQSGFTLLHGPADSSLRTVLHAARGLSADAVGSYTPHGSYQLRIAKRLGFRVDPWGRHCIVFEKRI